MGGAAATKYVGGICLAKEDDAEQAQSASLKAPPMVSRYAPLLQRKSERRGKGKSRVLAASRMTRNTQRQPTFWAMKPPAIGPVTGPTRGPSMNRPIHFPRLSLGITSARVPPESAMEQAPVQPASKRSAMKEPTLFAKAQPMVKPIYKTPEVA